MTLHGRSTRPIAFGHHGLHLRGIVFEFTMARCDRHVVLEIKLPMPKTR